MSLNSNATVLAALGGARDTAVTDTGGFYVGITPTPGTGVAGNASGVATFVETTPFLVIYNSGLLNIYPTHIRMHTTVIGTGNSTAAHNWTFTLDTGNRYSSGGTALTINNLNMLSANKSAAIITVGAVTATAASNVRRIVGHQAVKFGAIETVHDCLQFNFGGAEQCDPTSLINNAASLSHTTVNFAPLVIGPNQSLVAVRWVTANTALPTYEVEVGFIEK